MKPKPSEAHAAGSEDSDRSGSERPDEEQTDPSPASCRRPSGPTLERVSPLLIATKRAPRPGS